MAFRFQYYSIAPRDPQENSIGAAPVFSVFLRIFARFLSLLQKTLAKTALQVL